MIKTWSNDDCELKIRCWQKILTFDDKKTILPLQLTVAQMGLLTVQTGTVSLETWHVGDWGCIEAYETWLNHWKPQILWKNQNPNFVLTALGGGLTVYLLSNLEPFGDDSWQILKNMGGQILGYNNCYLVGYNFHSKLRVGWSWTSIWSGPGFIVTCLKGWSWLLSGQVPGFYNNFWR